MNDRAGGYLLLLAGLLIMFGSLIQVLLVFTGKIEPIPLFNIEAPKISLSNFLPTVPGVPNIPTNAEKPLELIPTSAFNKTLNMSINLFLMGFVLSFGFKVASLGIMLLRPITVKVASKPEQHTP